MKVRHFFSAFAKSPQVKHVSGKTFVDIIRSLEQSRGPVSAEGYIKRAETKDSILFGESPRAELWVKVPVGRINELEHLGQALAADGLCEKVRLIL